MAIKTKDIIIGKPIVEPWYIFCKEKEEWNKIKDDMYYTEERFLPKIMVDLGIVKSISEVRYLNLSICLSNLLSIIPTVAK